MTDRRPVPVQPRGARLDGATDTIHINHMTQPIDPNKRIGRVTADGRNLGKEIQNEFAHLSLPKGPHGLTGEDAVARARLTGPGSADTARALYRALLTPETRKRAEDLLFELDRFDLGVNQHEDEALRYVASRPAPAPASREPKVMVHVNITRSQEDWLRSQGSNLSETVREILDLAMGVGS